MHVDQSETMIRITGNTSDQSFEIMRHVDRVNFQICVTKPMIINCDAECIEELALKMLRMTAGEIQ